MRRFVLKQSATIRLAVAIVISSIVSHIVVPQLALSQSSAVTIKLSREFQPLPDSGTDSSVRQLMPKPGENVSKLTARAFKVESSFGGEFINRINDQPRAEEHDRGWFYYVNGIMANVGAGSYQPRAGDSIVWDLHSVSPSASVAAILGSFPEPFRGGYAGKPPSTLIAATASTKSLGARLRTILLQQGVAANSLHEGEVRDFDVSDVRISVGTWSELAPHFKAVSEAAERLGVFVRFIAASGKAPCGLEALSWERQVVEVSPTAAVFLPVAAAYNTTPQFILTACSADSLEKLLVELEQPPQILQGRPGLWFDNGRATSIPRGQQ